MLRPSDFLFFFLLLLLLKEWGRGWMGQRMDGWERDGWMGKGWMGKGGRVSRKRRDVRGVIFIPSLTLC